MGKNLDGKYLDFLYPQNKSSKAATFYQNYLQQYSEDMQLIQAFIFDQQFEILSQTNTGETSSNLSAALILNQNDLQQLKSGNNLISLPFKGHDGIWYLWGFYRINENYYIGVQESATRLSTVDQLAQIFTGIGIIGILLTGIAGWWLSNTVSRPVEKLVNFSRDLGSGKFDAKIPDGIKAELKILANALDKMRNDLARQHRDKEQMLAQIAHEIRNPLGGIDLLAGLVKEDLEKNNLDSNYIQKISQEIAKLKTLINAYLNYSRPVQPRPEWVNVSNQLEEIKSLWGNQLKQKNIQLQIDGNNFKVWFDSNHFRQILTNLISNSLEIIKDNGVIKIWTEQEQQTQSVHVSDNGPGIHNEDLPHVFEPFFSTREEGTGLGLAVCKRLCEENQADIQVNNNSNGGCTFTIKIENKYF